MSTRNGLSLLVGALLVVAALSTSRADTNGLCVLTWNIHIGRGMDKKVDLDRIAAVIRASEADLVALQELDQGTRRSQGADQPAELARRLPGYTPFFASAMPHDGGAYGVCVFSRLPVRSTRRIALSGGGGEPRAAAVLEVEWGGRALTFVGTHLENANDALRLSQAKQLEAALGGCAPAVLAGDFNAAPTEEAPQFLGRTWTFTWAGAAPPTWPADLPRIAIDHVLVRPASAAAGATCEVVNEPVASDHRPVRAVIRF